MDLRETYNKIARGWAKDHEDDTWWKGVTDHFVSLLDKGDWVLDVGCGGGTKTEYLRNSGLNVVGLDFSVGQIEIAREKNPKTEFILSDIREDINVDKKFDGIFAQAVLLHIPESEIEEAIKNIAKPLKEGGYFYIAIKEPYDGKIKEETLKECNYGYEFERLFCYYTREEMENILKGLGFEIVHSESQKFTHTIWGQVIAKKSKE